jgi:hypothetical protein
MTALSIRSHPALLAKHVTHCSGNYAACCSTLRTFVAIQVAPRGDFIRVVHIPSGVERMAMRVDSSHDELLDAVLEELAARNSNPERGG